MHVQAAEAFGCADNIILAKCLPARNVEDNKIHSRKIQEHTHVHHGKW